MRAAALAFALALAMGCDPASPVLRLRIDASDVGQCPSTDCMEVPLTCRSFMSIRVVDPADPTAPYLSQCEELISSKDDLCVLAGIDLDDTKQLPLRDLEVQVAVFPESMVGTDPMTGERLCPADTKYDATTGFPVASDTTPGVGGRSFYRPGDDKVVVNLGCTNLEAISSCGSASSVHVTAQVNDFFSGVGVTDDVTVGVGEPFQSGGVVVLPQPGLTPLRRNGLTWSGDVEDPFSQFACLAVLDEAAQSTTSVVCRRATSATTTIAFTGTNDLGDPDFAGAGVRLSKAGLDQILQALQMTSFPAQGMTIGIVLDRFGNTVANQTVTSAAGSVQYLSADRQSFGGTKTTSSGVWVSTDAPFPTTFSASTGVGIPVTRTGGLVENKVTIVVLQFGQGIGGQ